jgi:hypothetical protein
VSLSGVDTRASGTICCWEASGQKVDSFDGRESVYMVEERKFVCSRSCVQHFLEGKAHLVGGPHPRCIYTRSVPLQKIYTQDMLIVVVMYGHKNSIEVPK